MNSEDSIVSRAKAFALQAHDGQWLYNKPGVAVSAHLEEVAGLVQEAGGTAEEIAAAWLHDTVEDTSVTLDEIGATFGEKIAALVEGLTDAKETTMTSMSDRKKVQAERMKMASNSIKLVKLADQAMHCRMAGTIHNSFDAKTCLEYIESARLIAENCTGVSSWLDGEFTSRHDTSKAKLLQELEAAKTV